MFINYLLVAPFHCVHGGDEVKQRVKRVPKLQLSVQNLEWKRERTYICAYIINLWPRTDKI